MNIIKLSNGKKVGNFSSPHSFTFEDGSVLPAVSNEESNRLKVNFIETVDEDGDVILNFTLSEEVRVEMEKWSKLHQDGTVDVVFCPLPMITVIRDQLTFLDDTGTYHLDSLIKQTPFRSIRIEDRIKKLVSIHKQCI